ncbi:MAG TPA: amidohydrolase family protein [Gemmatimonadales bacterium]|nr:amidohydrolase family protein [Gemmatimonadales bacterium]
MLGRFTPAAIGLLAVAPLQGQAQDSLLVIRAGHLVDVQRGTLEGPTLILIKGERIVQVSPGGTVPAGARAIDLSKLTIMPGLIDAHVHLTIGTPDSTALATLRAGFTTVQDLGALNHANLDLRNAIESGKMIGPRIHSAGSWIGVKGGICDFDGRGVRGENEFAVRTREDIANGADLIKVCVTGWPADGYRFPDSVEITEAELAAVVREAKAANKKVIAHAIGRRGAFMAVSAGVEALAHSAFLDSTTIAMMKTRGVYLIPTLLSFQGDSPALLALQKEMRMILASGVPIAMGTDAGVTPHGGNAVELQTMVAAGMPPLSAIRSATSNAAALLGMAESIGSISQGTMADLIGVEGNPLEDVRTLQHVLFVMKAGRTYLTP